jgi:beta-galactosidase
MKMILILPLLLAAMSVAALAADPAARSQVLLSEGAWQFVRSGDLLPERGTAAFDEAAWEPVELPHVFQTRAKPGEIQEGWYRSQFSVPSEDNGKRLYLRFEGAATVADVYVNGNPLGQHRGAYTAFIFDTTEALNTGTDNVLAVRVDDRPASMADCLPNGSRLYKVWGGLYRKVWLIATDSLHIDPTDDASPGVYITPTNVTDQGAELSIRALVVNRGNASEEATVRAVLLDPSDKAVQAWTGHRGVSPGQRTEIELKGHVEHPNLWAPGSPNLYHVRVDVLRGERVTDSVTQPTGFRSVVWKDGIVMWNGKQILLAGADLHQETESKASAMSDDDFRADYALVQDLGAKWMRLPHYLHAQFEYDLCDQLGIAVWAENGHTNKETPTPNAQRITTEMVKQN